MTTNETRKTALVFGGARGIGAAAVRRLAADGYAVAFTYVSRPDKANELVAEIASRDGDALAIEANSADPAAIGAAVAAATEHFGKLSVIVVNAGILKIAPIGDVTLEDLDQMISINVRGVYLAIQASLPQMKDGGRVITIGSNTATRTGHPGTSVYQFTKAAVAAMVKGIALDLAPRRITVNNVQPGPTDTDMNVGAIEMLSNLSPMKRVADPAEVAGVISYLARDEAGFMTGASLTIDGGWVL